MSSLSRFLRRRNACHELSVSDSPILVTALLDCQHAQADLDVAWYDSWVRRQIEDQPHEIFSQLILDKSEKENGFQRAFESLWTAVWLAVIEEEMPSLNAIIKKLETKQILHVTEDEAAKCLSRYLALAVIGWQSMLFRADLGSCPLSQIAIKDETDGYRGNTHVTLKQDQWRCSSPLNNFLSGYGLAIPCPEVPTLVSDEDKAALREFSTASPSSLNALFLSKLARVTFRWTDSLACHLEFDTSSHTLWLFRYPTFCILHLRQGKDGQRRRTTLYGLCNPVSQGDYWATHEHMDGLLNEVLLSYRLLFGQHKASRALFRTMSPFDNLAKSARDPFLSDLCCQTLVECGTRLDQKELYDLPNDFPVLREKLVVLSRHLSTKRPRTWRELWSDKRDSAHWFTFWIVLIIGGVGILFGFLQLVLQTISTVLQVKSSS